MLYTLNIDGFNVEGLNLRGASTSCTIIALANLGLPEDERYKTENIFVAGIIPGPKEANKNVLNYYIAPLMTEFADSWTHGIHYSCTSLYPDGIMYCSAIDAHVCNLQGAHRLIQMSGPTACIFCPHCDCWHVTSGGRLNYKGWKSLRGRTDFNNWQPWDRNKLRRAAQSWQDAPSTSARRKIEKTIGVRWSPLWLLPYYSPAQVVVDGMHCFFEGVLKDLERNLLCLTDVNAAKKPPTLPAFLLNLALAEVSKSWPMPGRKLAKKHFWNSAKQPLPLIHNEDLEHEPSTKPWPAVSDDNIKDIKLIYKDLTTMFHGDVFPVDNDNDSNMSVDEFLANADSPPPGFIKSML